MYDLMAGCAEPLQFFQGLVEDVLVGLMVDFVDLVLMAAFADVITPLPHNRAFCTPIGSVQVPEVFFVKYV